MKKQIKKKKNELKNFWRKNQFFVLLVMLIALFAYDNYTNNGILKVMTNGNAEQLKSYIFSFGYFAPLVFLFFVMIQVIFSPIPGILIAIVGGLLFNPLLAGTLVWLGVIIGSSICFYIARKLGRTY